MDGNLWVGTFPKSSTCATGKLPSMALDSGIHDRNDDFSGLAGLVYNDERSSVGTINPVRLRRKA
jgi:hypothetical protein